MEYEDDAGGGKYMQVTSPQGRVLTVLGDASLLTDARRTSLLAHADTDPRIATISLVSTANKEFSDVEAGWIRGAGPAGPLVLVANDFFDLLGQLSPKGPDTWQAWFDAASDMGLWHRWCITSDLDAATAPTLIEVSPTDMVETLDLSGSHSQVSYTVPDAENLTITVDASWLGPSESGSQVMLVAAIDALARRRDVFQIRLTGVDELPEYAHHLTNYANVTVASPDQKITRTDVMWFPHQIHLGHDEMGEGRLLAERVVVTYLDFISHDIESYHKSLNSYLAFRAHQRRVALAADGVTTISSDVAERVFAVVPGIDRGRIQPTVLGIDHVLDTGKLEELKGGGLTALKIFLKRYGSGATDRPFCLVFGTGYLHKNRDFSIQAWQRLLEVGVECDLVIAGAVLAEEGTRATSERDLAESHISPFGDVFLVDWNVDSACRLWLLANAAVVLYPTSAEGFGFPPYEAASLGTPASFTSFGPLREISGVPDLPEMWTIEEYARDLFNLLTDSHAAHRRVEYLKKAVARHTWDQFALELVTFFKQVVHMPTSPAGVLAGQSEIVTEALGYLFSGSPALIEKPAEVLISVVVPTCSASADRVRQCLDSVLEQSARHWQLVVVAPNDADEDLALFLTSFFETHAGDGRVIEVRQKGDGMGDALNAGLESANGEYVGFLDPDDLLDARCIEEFAVALLPRPDAAYCDEDKFVELHRWVDPYQKPDFSPELLLAQNYLCHFAVFRRLDVVRAGGFREEFEWAQDFDLVLRLLPDLRDVMHIPKVLYHWRVCEESRSLQDDEFREAREADARAQLAYMERTFGGGSVSSTTTRELNRIHPRIDTLTRVSVIIPTIGKEDGEGGRLVDAAVRTLVEGETRLSLEFVIVTTGVIPPVQIGDLRGHTLRHVVYQTSSFNFSEAVNLGRSEATGDYLLLLNDDTTVAEADPVSRMLEIAQIPGVAVTGCLLTFPDGRIQHAGMIFTDMGPYHCWEKAKGDFSGYFDSLLMPRNFLAVTAAAMLIRTSVFDELNGFDPLFAIDFNDVDFCLRARKAGHRVAWTPYAHWVHHENSSLKREQSMPLDTQHFWARWSDLPDVDPYYSPALNPRPNRLYEVL